MSSTGTPRCLNGIWSSISGRLVLEDSMLECPVFFAGGRQQIQQPGCRVRVAVDVQVLVADHVGDDKGLDLLERPVLRPLRRKMPRAVQRVAIAPRLDSLFTIVEDQPDAVALRRMRAQVVAKLDQQR